MCEVSTTTTVTSATKQLGLTAGKLALVATLALGTSFSAAPAYASANEFLGLLGGAVGGGFIGNQFGKGSGRTWATAGGAVLGGLAGTSVGRSLDRGNAAYYGGGYGRGDRYYSGYSSNTVYYTEPAPQRVYYVPSYEQRVRRVEVVPQPVYVQPTTYVVDNSYGSGYGNSGSYCREYNQGVTVGGRTQASYGTACMQPDGSWKIQ